MKKLLISAWLIAMLSNLLSAQAPQQLNYQAVVRNNTGNTVANNTPVKLKFTIHDGSASGTSVFTETQNTTANQFGLVNVQIGSVSNLSPVNWGSGTKFLQVEVDVNNTGTFTDMGTTQLISVPFALNSARATVADTVLHVPAVTALWDTSGTAIYNTNSGYVGIGTTNPSFQLETTEDVLVNGIRVGRGHGNESTNTALGNGALLNNSTNGFPMPGGNSNTATGYHALYSNTDGSSNTANGNIALSSNTTGNYNCAFGTWSLTGNTTGTSNTAMGGNSMSTNTSGYDNSGFGGASLYFTSNGYQNSALGRSALINNSTGYKNSAIGYLAGETNTTGNLNTYVGANANSADGLSNATALGAGAYVGASNSLVLGNNASVGIGTSAPKAKLQVSAGDVYVDDSTKGVIMKSPNGTCYRLTVANGGSAVFTLITCP